MPAEGMESIGTGFEGLEKLLDEHRQQQSAEEPQEVAGDTPASAEDTGDVPAQQGGAGATSHRGQSSHRSGAPKLSLGTVFSSIGQQSQRALNSFLQPRGPNMATLDENGGLSVAAARWKLAGKVVMTMPGSEPHDIAKMQRDEQAAAGEPVFSKATRPPRSFHGGKSKASPSGDSSGSAGLDCSSVADGIQMRLVAPVQLCFQRAFEQCAAGGIGVGVSVLTCVATCSGQLSRAATEASDSLQRSPLSA